MPTPSIQTLVTDAQQVLNLDSISAVRSVVAVALANANTGTPLNPNLTTQQLWNEFYQVVNKPKSDIESIIANQLMKLLYAPPAPGGVGADQQVIFNDGGVLAGDPQFLWNKTTNLLTVTGSATITGDLTVDTSTLKVDSANNRVGIGTASPAATAEVNGGNLYINGNAGAYGLYSFYDRTNYANIFSLIRHNGDSGGTQIYNINSSADRSFNFYSGTTLAGASLLMTLNSTGLGVGATPASALSFPIGTIKAVGMTASVAHQAGNVSTLKFGIYDGGGDFGGVHVFNIHNGTYSSSEIGFFTGEGGVSVPTQRMRIDKTGNVGVGVTPSASGGCLQLKSGITFPATQVASSDANTLDDYEEGTWVGTIGGTTGNPTTPVTSTGRYTKIGRQVSVEIGFYGDTTGASGRITVSGLPFTSNASVARTGAIMMDTIGTFTGSPVAYLGVGVTVIDLYASNSNAGNSNVTHNAGAGRALYMELTYTV